MELYVLSEVIEFILFEVDVAFAHFYGDNVHDPIRTWGKDRGDVTIATRPAIEGRTSANIVLFMGSQR